MSVEKENPLRAEKRRKLHEIKAAGLDPFPHNFKCTHKTKALLEKYAHLEAGDVVEEALVTLAGRLMTKRDMGKASFFNIQDQQGRIQCYVKSAELNEAHQQFFKQVDIGDIIGVTGHIFKTKKGELSVRCKEFSILCKSLEPLPEKFHGLTDVELKYRYRHLDLIMNPESRKVFEVRSQIIREMRRYLDDAGFLEVEVPILQPIYGGAAAKPFKTHHNALDMELYLKISPELYLKRLIVGGFEKVYDLSKNFRNEGIDRSHNPEFAMLEWYEAYSDYNDQMVRFENIISQTAQKVTGSMKVTYQEKEIDFTPPWRRLTVKDSIREYAGFDPDELDDQQFFEQLKKMGSHLEKAPSRGHMLMEAFDLKVEEQLWQPTLLMDFPVEVSPLTKMHRTEEGLVERFEPICAGMEIGNSYSELNDPEDQYERLKGQEAQRATDDEAHPMDDDFIHAIDVGMPPTGGVGIGVERIVMLLTNQPSIRDIILFPTMKHKSK